MHRIHARLHATEPAARRSHEWGDDVLAEARAQRRTQVADAIGKAELDRLAAGPVFAGEQGLFGTLEPRTSAALHEVDEVLVDVPLLRLEPLDVLRILRKEWIAHGLVLAGNIKPAFDAELLHELGKAERAADDSDGAEDGGGIAEDLVTGADDHVAAGGGHILGKDDRWARVLVSQLADACIDQVRLHRRAAGRIDQQRDRPRVAHVKGALERTGNGGKREAGFERRRKSDDAREPYHRNHRHAAEPRRQ